MRVGDKVHMIPAFLKDTVKTAKVNNIPLPYVDGVVTHINKQHRWYMVQFEPGYRECFKF